MISQKNGEDRKQRPPLAIDHWIDMSQKKQVAMVTSSQFFSPKMMASAREPRLGTNNLMLVDIGPLAWFSWIYPGRPGLAIKFLCDTPS